MATLGASTGGSGLEPGRVKGGEVQFGFVGHGESGFYISDFSRGVKGPDLCFPMPSGHHGEGGKTGGGRPLRRTKVEVAD